MANSAPPTLVIAACLCAGAVGVRGQPEVVRSGGLTWRPVEQGFADASPLAARQRWEPIDLRVPMDFSRVYALDTTPRIFGRAAAPTHYARMSGGIVAVFPKSSYINVGGNMLFPEVPAGTTFSIGGPLRDLVGHLPTNAGPALIPGAGQLLAPPRAVMARHDANLSARGAAPAEPPARAAPRTIWNDERTRQASVESLFGRLAGGR